MYPVEQNYPSDINIRYLDPWESKIIFSYPHHNNAVWSDKCAYNMLRNYRWVYDKMKVAVTFEQGTTYYIEDAQKIDEYPVIVKPRTNLDGMSIGFRVCNDFKDLWSALNDKPNKNVMMIQKKFSGDYFNIDSLMMNGKVLDSFGFTAEFSRDGSFKCFESVRLERSPWKRYRDKAKDICEFIRLDRGCINIEMIGGHVVDIHLRPSVQFHDICGGLIPKYPKMMRTGVYGGSSFEKTYSRIYRLKEDFYVDLKGKLPDIPSGVKSVQLCFEGGKKLSHYCQDENSFRLFVINGKSLKTMERYSKELLKKIKLYKEIGSG